MPAPGGQSDLPEDVKKGDVIRAADFNKILAVLRRQQLAPGTFQSGSFSATRPIGRPTVVYDIAITETQPGCDWDKTTGERTPKYKEFPIFKPSPTATTKDKFDVNVKVKVKFTFKKQIDVTPGKFRIGKCVNGECFNVDCDELDMPT